jgi:prepilin-type processing-associated H-X9-DG protein
MTVWISRVLPRPTWLVASSRIKQGDGSSRAVRARGKYYFDCDGYVFYRLSCENHEWMIALYWRWNGCCSPWSNGYNIVTENVPPNWKYPDGHTYGCGLPCAGPKVMSARSRHPGGVNVAMGDASVRFISSTIDLATWQYLGSRQDGKPVTVP